MARTFLYEFYSGNSLVHSSTVQLTVQQIEDAGLKEVLQTPGPALGPWPILSTLLAHSPFFVFREPLGQAREVKVALSGLFGRFVARAYLEACCNLSIFVHLGHETVVLDGTRTIQIVRRKRGDLPDWVADNSLKSDLTVAEAKGSHDPSGPLRALERAWDQTKRVDVHVGGQRVPIRRLAIATRWGMSTGGPSIPKIAVRDPVDEGSAVEPFNYEAAFVGLFRHHIANMVSTLGHVELASALRYIATTTDRDDRQSAIQQAREFASEPHTVDFAPRAGVEIGALIGGSVAHMRSLFARSVLPDEHQLLHRRLIREQFVGIGSALVQAVIDGEPSSVREELSGGPTVAGSARRDRAGCWIVPFDDEDPVETQTNRNSNE